MIRFMTLLLALILLIVSQVHADEPADPALFPVQVKGKWGYIDREGEIVIEPKWAEVGDFSEGLAAAKGAEGWGYIDARGKWKILPHFDQVGVFTGGAATAIKDPFIGFIDRNGGWIVMREQQRSEIPGSGDVDSRIRWNPFSEGIGVLRDPTAGLLRFYDIEGKLLFELQGRYSEGFSEGLCSVWNSQNLYGVVDKTGTWVIPLSFNYIGKFVAGLAYAEKGEERGYIDRSGSWKLKLEAKWGGPFREGFARASEDVDANGHPPCGFINLDGEWAIEPKFKQATDVKDGRAVVQLQDGRITLWDVLRDEQLHDGFEARYYESSSGILDGGLARITLTETWALLDKDFNLVELPGASLAHFTMKFNGHVYDERKSGNRTEQVFYNSLGEEEVVLEYDSLHRSYDEGYMPFLGANGMWGLLNPDFEVVLEPSYQWVSYMHDDRATARDTNGKWGVIDLDGEWIVPPTFDRLGNFYEGRASFSIKSLKSVGFLHGFIDEQGEVLIDPVFESAGVFFEGMCPVKENGKWGYISRRGLWLIRPRYDYAQEFQDGIALVQLDGKYGFINRLDNWVIEPDYDFALVFAEGLAAVGIGKGHRRMPDLLEGTDFEMWYIDRDGRRISDNSYDYARWFSEGLAAVRMHDEFGDPYWEYIDKSGDVKTGLRLVSGGEFNEGQAVVLIPRRTVYLDMDGNVVWQPTY